MARLSRRRRRFVVGWLLSLAAVLALTVFVAWPPAPRHESVREVMKDAVLHEHDGVAFFGLTVNPAVVSAYLVTAMLLAAAAVVRVVFLPRFRSVPTKGQAALEVAVEFFAAMAREKSPHRPRFVGAYVFSAAVYVFFGTLFELLGVPIATASGRTVTLPAPLADINAALAMGIVSFAVIVGAGVVCGGARGLLRALKEFSLPLSMSFRLFGALLSGLLVTELIYYYTPLSFGLPVLVAVLFTLLHAIIQAYVLAMLVAIFYGEAVERKTDEKG